MLDACQHDPFTTPDAVFTVDDHIGRGPMLVVYTTRNCLPRPLDAPRFITIEGELDAYSAEHLASVLVGMIGSAPEAIIDVSEVTFIDTHGLAALEEVRDRSNERGARLWLHEPPGAVQRLLDHVAGAEQFRVCSTGAPSARVRRSRTARSSVRSVVRHLHDGTDVFSSVKHIERHSTDPPAPRPGEVASVVEPRIHAMPVWFAGASGTAPAIDIATGSDVDRTAPTEATEGGTS